MWGYIYIGNIGGRDEIASDNYENGSSKSRTRRSH